MVRPISSSTTWSSLFVTSVHVEHRCMFKWHMPLPISPSAVIVIRGNEKYNHVIQHSYTGEGSSVCAFDCFPCGIYEYSTEVSHTSFRHRQMSRLLMTAYPILRLVQIFIKLRIAGLALVGWPWCWCAVRAHSAGTCCARPNAAFVIVTSNSYSSSWANTSLPRSTITMSWNRCSADLCILLMVFSCSFIIQSKISSFDGLP